MRSELFSIFTTYNFTALVQSQLSHQPHIQQQQTAVLREEVRKTTVHLLATW